MWINFFFGTPRRLLASLVAAAIIAVLIEPGLLGLAVARLMIALEPVLGPIIQLVIIVLAFRIIFSVFSGGRKK